MRLIHLDSGRDMRGGQWQALYLLRGLVAQGHQVTLLARAGAPLYEALAREGFDVQPLGAAALVRLSGTADVVHAHDARSHALAALAARCPVVVARRVAFPLGRSPLSRWKYTRAAHFIAVSEFVKRTLTFSGIPSGKISVVADGVPLPGQFATGSAVLAPATDDPQKGTDLVRAAAALGGFAVRFAANLAGELPEAGLFLYLTRQEGLGSAVLLAMAYGVPVVASRVGGLPEAVEHGRTGLLVENTPEAAAAAVRSLLADPARARHMGECGRRLAAERFSIAAMVRGTLWVYHRVLSC